MLNPVDAPAHDDITDGGVNGLFDLYRTGHSLHIRGKVLDDVLSLRDLLASCQCVRIEVQQVICGAQLAHHDIEWSMRVTLSNGMDEGAQFLGGTRRLVSADRREEPFERAIADVLDFRG